MSYTVVQNGDQVTILVKVSNPGPGSEPNGVVTLMVPLGLEVVSADPNKGSYDPVTGEWTIGKIGPGDIYQMDVTVEVTNLLSAPFTLSAAITGDAMEIDAPDNTITYTINKVSDIITATAVDDNNLSLSYDLSKNDTECSHCDTKWVIQTGTLTNVTILEHDETTGKGELRLDDITVDGSFIYDLVCYGCGDGLETVLDSANVIVPKLTDSIGGGGSGDVSTIEINPGGLDDEVYRHSAGGVDTDIDVGQGRIVFDSLNPATGILTLTFKNGKTHDVDLSNLLPNGDIQSYSYPTPETLRIVQDTGITDIDVSSLLPVTNDSLTLQGASNETLRLTDSNGDFVDSDISPIVVTGISIDESAAPTKTITITFADGSVVTGSFTDDTASGGGDNWGTQVVQSDTTLLGDGTALNPLGVDVSQINSTDLADIPIYPNDGGNYVLEENNGILTWIPTPSGAGGDDWGTQVVESDLTLDGDGTSANPLSVSPTDNPMVSSFEINVTDDLVLTLTDGTQITITNAAMKAAFDTDTTILTDVSLVGNELRITDDVGVKTVDLSPLVVTTLDWIDITGKPILSQDGGNVTGFIDLNTETFTLTSPDPPLEERIYTLHQTIIPNNVAINSSDDVKDKGMIIIPTEGVLESFSFTIGEFIGGTDPIYGDLEGARVRLIQNPYQVDTNGSVGEDIEGSTESVVAYISIRNGHRKQVLAPSGPPLNFQAGDVLLFDIVNDTTEGSLTGILSEGFSVSLYLSIPLDTNPSNSVIANS